jgi:hypothetical protein
VSNCDGGRRLRVRLLSSSQSLGYTFVQYVPLVLQLWTLPESNLVYAMWTFKMVCTKGRHTPSPSALTEGWMTSLGKVCLHALDLRKGGEEGTEWSVLSKTGGRVPRHNP